MNLPSAFLTRMQEMLGEEYEAFLQSYESGHYQSLRLNPRKTDREEFTEKSPFHLTPVAWEKNGFYYSEEDTPGKHPYHEAGVYYIQEASAMAPVGLSGRTTGGLCAGSVRCPRREKHPDRCCDAGKRYFSLQ